MKIIISAFVGVAFFCDGGLSLRLDLLLLLDKYLELSGRECVKEEKRVRTSIIIILGSNIEWADSTPF